MPAVIRRVTLAPNTLTPLFKPGGSSFAQVSILNATTEHLFAYSGDTPAEDVDNFMKIPPGIERLIRFCSFGSDDPIVFMKSRLGGEVVLIWG